MDRDKDIFESPVLNQLNALSGSYLTILYILALSVEGISNLLFQEYFATKN